MDVNTEIKKYIDEKKELYDLLFQFLEDSLQNDADFQHLIDFLEKHKYKENTEEFEHFLHLISSIVNNYHRNPNFFEKIEKILHYFVENIKQIYSNYKLLDFFSKCNPLLLFLLKNNVIEINEDVLNYFQLYYSNKFRYCHFLYPQIKPFISEERIRAIESELLEFDSDILNNFEEKQKRGENNSYICELIRNDSVEEFIQYVTRNNITLSSIINPSIFETNSFLIENDPSLIEYAAFYGSIQIIKYLSFNKIELSPSLWLYAIHSNNAELINYLEENDVLPEDKSYSKCLSESIKCHHNNLANYIYINLTSGNTSAILISKLKNKDYSSIYCYENYTFFPYDFDDDTSFFYLCKYHYFKLVNFFLDIKKQDIESQIINFKNIYEASIKFKIIFGI